MSDLRFAVLFEAVNKLSDPIRNMGASLTKFVDRVSEGGDRVREMGQRMVEWGERIGIATAVLSEGADKLHEWAEAMSEPALGMQQSMASMAAMSLRPGAVSATESRGGSA